MFARIGRSCYRHRLTVVIAWLVALVAGGVIASAVGSGFRSEFTLPDTESKRGQDIIIANFAGVGTGRGGTIVFRADQGVDAPEVKQAMISLFEAVGQIPGLEVTSPYDQGAAQQISSIGADAGKVAFATVDVPGRLSQAQADVYRKAVEKLVPEVPGLQVELGGQIFAKFEPPSSEALGLAFAIFILIIAFGSVLAMGLPVGVALAGIGVGSILVALASNVLSMPDITTTIGLMIGLGVGIDYALFIVTRYREGVHEGKSIEDATVVSINTAGRAVLFAGTTVVISLMGMLIMGVEFVRGLAIGASIVVAVTMVASLTLLPALLGFAGKRIEVTRWRGLIAASLVALAIFGAGLKIPALILVCLPLAVIVILASFGVAPLRKEVPRRPPKPPRETTAYRWSRVIQHHPWISVLAGLAFLLVLAIPVLGLRLGFSDEGNFPTDTTTRRAYDLLATGFGPGFNGPLALAANLPPGTDQATLDEVSQAIKATPGVASASPAITSKSGTAVLWRVIPTTAPQDEATTQLVHRLREDVLPQATAGSGLQVEVAGSVAANIDFSDYLAARLPWFFAVVLGLSFLLLMVVFRSLLVPLKAVVMNLLSIGAAYGLVVAIFQWGWMEGALNIASAPIEPFVPMMMFAIVFGLSMDYEVFLLSRIREEYLKTGDSRESVADGLAVTAKVITAAAAIMVFVFGSFILESNRVVKLFGIGLASAVLIDATVVRMLLVPATMELLGDKNWWLPRWLDRILPHIDVEGTAHPVDEELVPLPEREPVG